MKYTQWAEEIKEGQYILGYVEPLGDVKFPEQAPLNTEEDARISLVKHAKLQTPHVWFYAKIGGIGSNPSFRWKESVSEAAV